MFAARVKRTVLCGCERYLQIEVLLRTKNKPLQRLFEMVHRILYQVVESSPALELAEIAEHIRNGLNEAIKKDADLQFYTDWIKVIEGTPAISHPSSNEVCSLLPQVLPGKLDVIAEPE